MEVKNELAVWRNLPGEKENGFVQTKPKIIYITHRYDPYSRETSEKLLQSFP